MDLDPMIKFSQEENDYSNYDNRPIRPMDQDALNEALAKLPILVDNDDSMAPIDSTTSVKTRRQPNLAYSTLRKNLSGMNSNHSVMNNTIAIETPMNNKRKIIHGTTPIITPSAKKLIKHIDYQQELIQLREEKQQLEETKLNLQLECIRLKKSHQAELESIEQINQQTMETLINEYQNLRIEMEKTISDQEELLKQTTIELVNLRDDHTLLTLEKETLNKMVAEYHLFQEKVNQRFSEDETTIKKLREEITQMKENYQQEKKLETPPLNLTKDRTILKDSTINRVRTNKAALLTNKINTKVAIVRGVNKEQLLKTPSLSINTSMNKSNSSASLSISSGKALVPKSKPKVKVNMDGKTKSISPDEKQIGLVSTRIRTKLVTRK